MLHMADTYENKFVSYFLFPIGTYLLAMMAASLWFHEVLFKASVSMIILFALSYKHGFKNYAWMKHKKYFYIVYLAPSLIAFFGLCLGLLKFYSNN
ncbi:hypothetical protein [Aliikangiella sp. IMCC44359]|uniref:hypothetical protein n=1 Tax=Aliikangiella sp. IMCC44359 TaxID=3459125 RepID=UPI00403AF8BF